MADGDWWDRLWDRLGTGTKRFWVGVAILATLALCGLVAWAIYSPTAPTFKNPNFVDAILENRLVMASVRVVIVGVAIYIVISVFGHVIARRWLAVAGPLKVADSAVRAVSQEADALQGQLEAAQTTINGLTRQLRTTTDALGVANRERDEIINEWSLERKRAAQQG